MKTNVDMSIQWECQKRIRADYCPTFFPRLDHGANIRVMKLDS